MYTNIKLSRENSQKKCVFRRALKVAKQADVLILLGRAFHKVAAATTKMSVRVLLAADI